MLAGRYGRGAPIELVIALINNMPAGAKRATQQQFAGLLAAASRHRNLRIRLLPVERLLSRTDDAFRFLRGVRPDALIVTGDQPQSVAVADEPLLSALLRLVGWAADNTISAVWSCLAAQAAVFGLDRIDRRRVPRKLSGMYACVAAQHHPLLTNFPALWDVPHSRENDLDEVALRDAGYTILSHGPEIGADSFCKEVRGSLFLFLQGHPEYGPDTLLKEYRRDVRRYVAGRSANYPEIPARYVDPRTAVTLQDVRHQAPYTSRAAVLATVDAALAAASIHRPSATPVQLYANWLALLAERKAARDARDGAHAWLQHGAA